MNIKDVKNSTLGFGLFLLILCPLTQAGGGNIDSGGAGNKPYDAGTAWFADDSTTTYCVSTTSDFGTSLTVAREQVRAAIQTWMDYFERKGGDTFNTGSGLIRLSREFKDVGECTEKEDLQFLLGHQTSDIQVLTKVETFRYAGTIRTSYDPKQRKGSGIVWVLNQKEAQARFSRLDWSDERVLRSVLIHEIGHLFGAEHIRGTIMDQEVLLLRIHHCKSQELLNWKFCKVMDQIDYYNELMPFSENSYEGYVDPWAAEALFEHVPQGGVSAKFVKNQNPLLSSFKLILKDSKETIELPILIQGNRMMETKLGNVSQVIFDGSLSVVNSAKTWGWVGQITLKSGKSINVIVQVNAELSPLRITTLELGSLAQSPLTLFEGSPIHL